MLRSLSLQAFVPLRPLPPPPGSDPDEVMGIAAAAKRTSVPKHLQDAANRACKAAGVPASWAHSSALWQLLRHESSLNPKAKNPTSTAYGLFQFLDSTWKQTGIKKSSDPYQQFVAGYRYIKRNYRSPEAAWAFWQKQSPHWY